MDNYGFHHGRVAEPLLRDILHEHGINLLFQPAYSPHLNTCEFCFNQVKCYLKQNIALTVNETEIAIGEAVSKISASNSVGYFRNCGLTACSMCCGFCMQAIYSSDVGKKFPC